LLVLRVSPLALEGFYLKINAKHPGSKPADAKIIPVAMDFSEDNLAEPNTTEAYELLLFDAVCGDTSYFTIWE
jgi:glucose-6-phosphate 1-dehydrogenase